jgi:hypothetical protein
MHAILSFKFLQSRLITRPKNLSKDAAPHDQGSHQTSLILGPIGAFSFSMVNSEVIHRTTMVRGVLARLKYTRSWQEALVERVVCRHQGIVLEHGAQGLQWH